MKAFRASLLAVVFAVVPASIGSAADVRDPRKCLLAGGSWKSCGLPALKLPSVKVPSVPLPQTIGEGAFPKPGFFEWYGPWAKSPTDYLSKDLNKF